ncbi:MAG: outer membrane lipoprotein carrier protein LolA [Kofleriaceae bacterium]|nr:outer membrane lipoprotein carrier protein LolA [Kofleriaceae bacterium]
MLAVAGIAFAQPAPPSAPTVLGNVQKFYANANHLTAQFKQVVTNSTFNTTKTSNGKLWVAKPTQFRWDYLDKARGAVTVTRTFVFDGTTLWVVDHKNKQLLQNQTQGGVLPAAVSFLTGGGNLAAQFNVTLDTSGTYGGSNATVLELTPKQPSAQYSKLFFVVDPTDWHISQSIVIASNGDTNAFNFYSPDLKSPVKASWFQVSPKSVPTYKLVVVNPVGTGSGSAQTPPAPPTAATASVPTSSATRCTLRVSKKGIYVDGDPKSRADAIAACKRTAGAMVVLEDDAPADEWKALQAGLRQGGVKILMRGPLNDNDCKNNPLAKGCN